MSWLGGLFSSDKIIDGGIKAVDALVFTDEERANLLMKYAESTLPMNMARRIIASIVAGVWALFVIACGVSLYVENAQTELLMDFTARAIMPPFTAIMSFYFLSQVAARRK